MFDSEPTAIEKPEYPPINYYGYATTALLAFGIVAAAMTSRRESEEKSSSTIRSHPVITDQEEMGDFDRKEFLTQPLE